MKVLEGNARRAVQAVLLAFSLATLVIPPVVVATSGTATFSATFTSLRIFALYAITIVFLNIMTGSFRPLLVRVFRARTMLRFHNTTGVVGFCLALTHGILVIIYGLWPGFSNLGPVALYVLAVTTFAVLLRKSLKKSWRWIHRFNYVVFLFALVHASRLGSDFYGSTFLKSVLYFYAALVAVGFIYRSQLAMRMYIKRRQAKSVVNE